MSKELGNKLYQLRSASGFTQQQIAKQLNVDRSTYSNYERAITEPDVNTLIKLAKIFGVDVNALLASGEDFKRVADPAAVPVYSLSKEEKYLIIRYRMLSSAEKEAAAEFIDKFLEEK